MTGLLDIFIESSAKDFSKQVSKYKSLFEKEHLTIEEVTRKKQYI